MKSFCTLSKSPSDENFPNLSKYLPNSTVACFSTVEPRGGIERHTVKNSTGINIEKLELAGHQMSITPSDSKAEHQLTCLNRAVLAHVVL